MGALNFALPDGRETRNLVGGFESGDGSAERDGTQEATSLVPAESWSGLPPAPESHDPLIGTTLHDTYVVDHILGEGGMGRVYEARHNRLPGKRFAIKVLHAELALNADLQARFQREAETAASIDHPGVVGIYDVGRTPQGWQYIVCEHLTGLELHRHIKQQGHLSQTTVVHIGRQLCDALDAAHEKTVIHRDLKPHNVFLVGDFSRGVPERPRVKVLDFGLSRFMGGDSQLTKTGVIMGTPGYMAPEQAHGRHADHRTDVYGVGAILYAAATGRPPFVEDTPQRTVLAVMSREPERPRLVEPSVSEALEIVIQRAMAKEPLLRYRDLKEMSRALSGLEVGPMLSMMPPSMPRSERGPPAPEEGHAARLRFVLVLLSLGGLGVAAIWSGVLGLLALRGPSRPLTATELVVITALTVMSAFPIALIARRLRRNVWPNSARVVDWLHTLRAPLIAGVCAYGVAAFGVRFADEVLGSSGRSALFGQGDGIAYRGYSVVLPLIGLLAGIAAAAQRRWWTPRRPVRRWLFGTGLTALVALVSLVLLYATLQMRASHPSVPMSPAQASQATAASAASGTPAVEALPAPEPEPEAIVTPAAGSTPPAGEASVVVPANDSTAPVLAERASEQTLAEASAQGRDALRALAQRYPRDPEVLKALFMVLASRTDTFDESLEKAKSMLEVAPALSLDREVRFVVTRATERGGRTAELAFAVLSGSMGYTGADLLYDLLLRKPELELRTKQALRDARRQNHVSPALAMAYDLRFAPTCAARLTLLSRASEVGDDRSISVLSSLASKPQGCRRTRYRPCRPKCDAESGQFWQTVNRISQRQRTRQKG
jgi:serine/threonine-protein kinase